MRSSSAASPTSSAKGNLLVLFDSAGNIKPAFARISNTVWFGVKTSIWIMVVVVVLLGFLLAADDGRAATCTRPVATPRRRGSRACA